MFFAFLSSSSMSCHACICIFSIISSVLKYVLSSRMPYACSSKKHSVFFWKPWFFYILYIYIFFKAFFTLLYLFESPYFLLYFISIESLCFLLYFIFLKAFIFYIILYYLNACIFHFIYIFWMPLFFTLFYIFWKPLFFNLFYALFYTLLLFLKHLFFKLKCIVFILLYLNSLLYTFIVYN